jgi:hypothetical protein
MQVRSSGMIIGKITNGLNLLALRCELSDHHPWRPCLTQRSLVSREQFHQAPPRHGETVDAPGTGVNDEQTPKLPLRREAEHKPRLRWQYQACPTMSRIDSFALVGVPGFARGTTAQSKTDCSVRHAPRRVAHQADDSGREIHVQTANPCRSLTLRARSERDQNHLSQNSRTRADNRPVMNLLLLGRERRRIRHLPDYKTMETDCDRDVFARINPRYRRKHHPSSLGGTLGWASVTRSRSLRAVHFEAKSP